MSGAWSETHLYDQDYFDRFYLHDERRDTMYRQERARIATNYPRGARVLDVGCAVGGFLAGLDDRWDKWGLEPSDYAAEKARSKGITMVPSIDVLDTGSFDVVVFRGTLQHIDLPMEALNQASRVLRRGGLLAVLATPDTDSLVYRIWGRLPVLQADRNWVLFGGRSLTNILERLGYVQIKVTHPYRGTPYARPLRDFSRFFMSLILGWRPFAFPGNMMEVYARKK